MGNINSLRTDKLRRLILENQNKMAIWEMKKASFPSLKMQVYAEMMVEAFKEKNKQFKKELVGLEKDGKVGK